MDWNDDGCGDFAGPRPAARLPRRPRRHLPVADAVLSDRRPRRRLRHHRLLRRRPAAGHARRLRRGGPDGERPRHAGDRRPGRQPHLGQAPVVPGGRSQHRLAVPRLLRLARRPAAGHHEARSSSPTRRTASGSCRREDRRVVPAPLLHGSSPTSTSPNPQVRDEIAKVMGFWLRARASSGFRVDAVPFLLETDGRRRGRGRSGSPTRTSTCARCASFVGRRTGDGDPARRGQPAARAAGGVLRRQGRRRADHAVRLHQHAERSTSRWPAATPDRWSRR